MKQPKNIVKQVRRKDVPMGMIKSETRCWERTRPACFDLAQIRHAGRVRSQDKSDF